MVVSKKDGLTLVMSQYKNSKIKLKLRLNKPLKT